MTVPEPYGTYIYGMIVALVFAGAFAMIALLYNGIRMRSNLSEAMRGRGLWKPLWPWTEGALTARGVMFRRRFTRWLAIYVACILAIAALIGALYLVWGQAAGLSS